MSWSTSELRVRVAPWIRFKPSSKIFYWLFQGGTSFMDRLCYLCLVFVMVSRMIIAALWPPAGKGLTSSLLSVMSCLWFCHFPIWYPESGVVLKCLVSWSLPSFLLCLIPAFCGISSGHGSLLFVKVSVYGFTVYIYVGIFGLICILIMFLKRLSFGSKECIEVLKLECASFLGQTI